MKRRRRTRWRRRILAGNTNRGREEGGEAQALIHAENTGLGGLVEWCIGGLGLVDWWISASALRARFEGRCMGCNPPNHQSTNPPSHQSTPKPTVRASLSRQPARSFHTKPRKTWARPRPRLSRPPPPPPRTAPLPPHSHQPLH